MFRAGSKTLYPTLSIVQSAGANVFLQSRRVKPLEPAQELESGITMHHTA